MHRIDKTETLAKFEKLVEKSRDRLFRFVYMRIGRREDSEDIIQEVLISFYKTLLSGKRIDNLERYLLLSVSNACIDYYRRRKIETVTIEETIQIAGEPVSDDDRDLHQEFTRIARLLEGLPIEQAETVRMKCYDGLTFRQIAELLQKPEATVKSRYRYAISTLQNKLKNER